MSASNIITYLKSVLDIEDVAQSPIRVSIFLRLALRLESGQKSVSWGGKARSLTWNQVHYPARLLAERIGVDRETVTRHFKFLELFGLITIESHVRDGSIITLNTLSAANDTAIHFNYPADIPAAIDATISAAKSAAITAGSAGQNPPLEIPSSNLEEKGNTTTGAYATAAPEKPTRQQLEKAWITWLETLEHHNIPPMNRSPQQERSLYQAILSLGFEHVIDALEGARFERASKDFNPKAHLSLDYCLHRNARTQRSNYERLGNLARAARKTREDQGRAYE